MITQISCKLSSSLLAYLEREGVPTLPVTELYDGPEEFLRDPHFWLSISQMESFFERASQLVRDDNLGRAVGVATPELHCWGALDNVFKLMSSKEVFYSHLAQMFTYFLAPLSPLKEIERGTSFVRFVFPLNRSDCPHVFEFLKATLENLPRYAGHQASVAEWSSLGGEMLISWDVAQPSLFTDSPGTLVNPRLVKELTDSLESSQRGLQAKNREIIEKQKEIDMLRGLVHGQSSASGNFSPDLVQLASGVAHEMNNPLAFVMSNLNRVNDYASKFASYIDALESLPMSLEDKKRVAQIKEHLDINYSFAEIPQIIGESQEGLERLKFTVQDLTNLVNPKKVPMGVRTKSDLKSLIESALTVFSPRMENMKIFKDYRLERPLFVYPARLVQVFINIIANALDATSDAGNLWIHTFEKDDCANIEIADNGRGIPSDIIGKIFDPFFTTKIPTKGTGMGLALSKEIIELHGGLISVNSNEGSGTKFTIKIPFNMESKNGQNF